MIQDESLERMKRAIDEEDLKGLKDAIASYTGDELTEGLLFSDQTIFMYACQNGTPEIVQAFIEQGVYGYEVKYSDTNEVKSAVRNRRYASQILPKVIELLPEEVALELVVSGGDPFDELEDTGDQETPLAIALANKDEASVKVLKEAFQRLRRKQEKSSH